jgi:hypothetical protein
LQFEPESGELVRGRSQAVFGALIGGLVAVSYNRSPFGVHAVVEEADPAQ